MKTVINEWEVKGDYGHGLKCVIHEPQSVTSDVQARVDGGLTKWLIILSPQPATP